MDGRFVQVTSLQLQFKIVLSIAGLGHGCFRTNPLYIRHPLLETLRKVRREFVLQVIPMLAQEFQGFEPIPQPPHAIGWFQAKPPKFEQIQNLVVPDAIPGRQLNGQIMRRTFHSHRTAGYRTLDFPDPSLRGRSRLWRGFHRFGFGHLNMFTDSRQHTPLPGNRLPGSLHPGKSGFTCQNPHQLPQLLPIQLHKRRHFSSRPTFQQSRSNLLGIAQTIGSLELFRRSRLLALMSFHPNCNRIPRCHLGQIGRQQKTKKERFAIWRKLESFQSQRSGLLLFRFRRRLHLILIQHHMKSQRHRMGTSHAQLPFATIALRGWHIGSPQINSWTIDPRPTPQLATQVRRLPLIFLHNPCLHLRLRLLEKFPTSQINEKVFGDFGNLGRLLSGRSGRIVHFPATEYRIIKC